MEGDDREGLVAEYLAALLPEGWDGMDLYTRQNFLNGDEFGGAIPQGTRQRQQVCVMEIWCECFGRNRETIKKGDS